MFPNIKFIGVDLYFWMIIIGVIAAIIYTRFVSPKVNISAKLYNHVVLTGLLGVVVGYLASILVQDFYSFIETGEWKVGAGSTFLGGLIGGLGFFHILYFVIGKEDSKMVSTLKTIII